MPTEESVLPMTRLSEEDQEDNEAHHTQHEFRLDQKSEDLDIVLPLFEARQRS